MEGPSKRIAKLIKFIYENPGKKPGEIAKAVGIGRRTLGNYLAQLKKEGIIETREKWKVYPPSSHTFFLSEEEKLYLAILLRFASSSIAFPLEKRKLEEIQEKILGKKASEILEKKRIYVVENPEPTGSVLHFSNVFHTVLSAIQEGIGLEILYKEAGDFTKEFEIIPLYIAIKRGVWYLLSHVIREEEKEFPPKRKKFKLTRIIRAEKREDIKREMDDDFGFFFKNAWEVEEGGDAEAVIIELDEKAYDLIREMRWHPSEEIVWRDGKLFYYVKVANPEEMIPWIAQFGYHAKIIYPDWLKEKFVSFLRKAIENY